MAPGAAPALLDFRPMTLQEIQVLFQSISSLALAGCFVYTAVQFKEWKKAAHVANFSKLVELQMSLRRLRVDEPHLASVYQHDVEGMSTDREIREHFMNLMQLSVFEIAWFGYRHQQLPGDYFQSWEKRMRAIAREASFRRMMNSPTVKILHDDFQAYIIQLMREAEREAEAMHPPGAHANSY